MATRKVPSLFGESFSKWYFQASRFNQYGLMHDDLLRETTDVKEALRRLPEHLQDERNFRLVRAMQLDCQKVILPKEQWTKYDDKNMYYLQAYLDEVIKERKEKEAWDNE